MKNGRKGKYETHVKHKLHLIAGWRKKGYTDADIMKKLDLSHQTFYRYKREKSDFSDALNESLDDLVNQAELSMYKRAFGYSYDEIKVESEYGEETKRTVTTKSVAPDYQALKYILENRCAEDWKSEQSKENNDDKNKHDPYARLTTEQLMQLIKK
jgi:transcriptional regulator with XRE-family HTH domain